MRTLFFTLVVLGLGFSSLQAQPFDAYLSLDGTDDFADASVPGGVIPVSGEFTVEGWFRTCAGGGYLFDARLDGVGGIEVEIQADDIKIRMENASSTTDTFFTTALNPFGFHHFALVHRIGGANDVYIDGYPLGSFNQEILAYDNFFFGVNHDGSSKKFDGYLEEWRVSDTVRYNSFFNPKGAFLVDAYTVALWHFDETAGSPIFTDEMGIHNLTARMGATTNVEQTVFGGGDGCPGTMFNLGAAGGASYEWSPGFGLSDSTAATPTVTPDVSTWYTVSIQDSNSCTWLGNVYAEVLEKPEAFVFSDENVICPEEETQLFATGGDFYSWSPIGSNDQNPTVTPDSSTTYTVIVTNSVGCTDTASLSVVVDECGGNPVGFGDLNPEDYVKLVNTAAADYWTVLFSLPQSIEATVQLVGTDGRRVLFEGPIEIPAGESSRRVFVPDGSSPEHYIMNIIVGSTKASFHVVGL